MLEHMNSDKLLLLFLPFAALLDFCEESATYCSNTAGPIHLWQVKGLYSQRSKWVRSPNIAPPCAATLLDISPISTFLLLPPRHQHPVDNAGLFSFMTLHWLSPLALRAYKASSLSIHDVWGLSCHEASEPNCER